MTDISVRTTAYQSVKRSWYLGTAESPGFTVSGTLDISAFDMATYWPNGFIQSGEPLGRLASGLYAPYLNQTNEVQKVTVATSGATTVGFGGNTAAATTITADAGGATVLQGLLEGLPGIDPGDVAITVGAGGDAGKLIVTFTGKLAGQDVGTLTATGTGASVATTTAGGADVGGAGAGTGAGVLFSPVTVPNPLNTAVDVGCAILVAFAPIRESKLPRAVDSGFKSDCRNLYFVGANA